MTATLYVLCDPTTGRPKYVGRSVNPELRLKGHESDARRRKSTKVGRWVASIAPLRPYLVLMSKHEGRAAADAAEKEAISLFTLFGADLMNLTGGGTGGSGPKSSETKAKIAAAHRGRKVSSATRAKMSASHAGKRHSPEWTEKIALAHRGMKRSTESRARMSLANKAWRARKKVLGGNIPVAVVGPSPETAEPESTS